MIKVDQNNRIPKYKQIVQEIFKNIKNGNFKHGDQLPSINELKDKLNVARDTVIKAYKELNTTGVISSMPGKGYYISKNIHEIEHRIFLLFDLFLSYKQTIFNSFMENIGEFAMVDIYFHHYNEDLYKKLILESIGQYTDYIIMPLEKLSREHEWFDSVLGEKNTYILDVGLDEYADRYPSVCQNFKTSWYEGLSEVEDRLRKYDRIVMVKYREPISEFSAPHDLQMLAGFEEFCKDKNFNCYVINAVNDFKVQKGECYVVSNDDDLVTMILEARSKDLEIGKDVGFISHNEEPLKGVVGKNGIATITTDFYEMGRKMAEMINTGKKESVVNPSKIIIRDSI